MLEGATITERLRALVKRWKAYEGSEVSEAQTFLNELFEAFGMDRKAVGAEFEDSHSSQGIMDLRWGSVCIVEMKRPSQTGKLAEHRKQALDYWHHSSDPTNDLPAARYVVLCSFHEFEVWEPGMFPTQPRATFALESLPDNKDALHFLSGHEPVFVGEAKDLTTDAAKLVASLHARLLDRSAAPPETLRLFALQAVWCMFADDLGLLPKHLFYRVLKSLRDDPSRSSAAELGYLFTVLNAEHGATSQDQFADAPYANGGLFAQPTYVTLEPEEVQLLLDASGYDWRQVDPTIFGSLMEGFLGEDRRDELGAHYTAASDIQRVIGPSIIHPWRERIEAVASVEEAEALANELASFRVLDPACGCGNFLYLTLREVRALTRALHDKVVTLRKDAGLGEGEPLPVFGLANLHGIEIHPFTALIARVTLWMGHKLVIDTYGAGPGEHYLPLADLESIQVGDAVFGDWPDVEAIVGNPPFIGTKFVRSRLSDEYVKALNKRFGVGVTDYVVYWFRRAHDHLGPGQHAGLVATNSIRDSMNRRAALDYLRDNGGIVHNAVSTQKWSGDANVHVSIVNWVKEPPVPVTSFVLDGRPVTGIKSTLEEGDLRPPAQTLKGNAGRQHAGVVPNPTDEFCVDADTAKELLARNDADYSKVVQPYLTGDDILQTVDQSPTRWIINFRSWPLEVAMQYPLALDLVRKRVKPIRDEHKNKKLRDRWWQFSRTLDAMWASIEGLDRYIVAPATGKRILMAWAQPNWCPSNATNIFPFNDDYAMGVLSSRWHLSWASQGEVSSKLKSDQRYISSGFHTFPWPVEPSDAAVEDVRTAARELIDLRTRLCTEQGVGLTTLYNQVDDGAHKNLVALHRALDQAVADAYGWPASEWPEFRDRLYELNQQIASDPSGYTPFGPASHEPAPTLF